MTSSVRSVFVVNAPEIRKEFAVTTENVIYNCSLTDNMRRDLVKNLRELSQSVWPYKAAADRIEELEHMLAECREMNVQLTSFVAGEGVDAKRYRWLRDKTTKQWLRETLVNSYNWDADVSAAMEAEE
jgi:hypothetical protein